MHMERLPLVRFGRAVLALAYEDERLLGCDGLMGKQSVSIHKGVLQKTQK